MNSLTDFAEIEASKKELLERGTTSDPKLQPNEKETNINFPNDTEHGNFYSDVPTTVKWFLSIEEGVVEGVRFDGDGKIIGVKGKIPKGVVKLKGSARKSNSHSQLVSYGPNND